RHPRRGADRVARLPVSFQRLARAQHAVGGGRDPAGGPRLPEVAPVQLPVHRRVQQPLRPRGARVRRELRREVDRPSVQVALHVAEVEPLERRVLRPRPGLAEDRALVPDRLPLDREPAHVVRAEVVRLHERERLAGPVDRQDSSSGFGLYSLDISSYSSRRQISSPSLVTKVPCLCRSGRSSQGVPSAVSASLTSSADSPWSSACEYRDLASIWTLFRSQSRCRQTNALGASSVGTTKARASNVAGPGVLEAQGSVAGLKCAV